MWPPRMLVVYIPVYSGDGWRKLIVLQVLVACRQMIL